MKKNLLFIIPVILLAIAGIASCKKLGVASVPITSDDAANMISGSLASNSNGLTTFSSDAAITSQALATNNTGCGVTHADTITRQSIPGAETAYSYTYKIINKLNCNTSNLPDNVTSALNFNGSFSGPRLSSNSSGSVNLTIAGLTPTATVYAINGEFKYLGSFKLKTDTTKTGTTSIDIVVKNVIVTKATVATPAAITGGTATATITGNSPKGAFLFTGTLTFTGGGSATLVLGSSTYVINLLTGVVTKQ